MYKVIYFYEDGTEETKVIDWRAVPEGRDLGRPHIYGHGGLKAYKVEKATEEESKEATSK